MQSPDNDFPFAQDFEWDERVFLGQGSYGKVFKVKSRKDGQFYAIKSMDMEVFNRDPVLMNSLKGEIAITSEISSEHTVRMIAYQMGQFHTYIILELCDSDLRKELSSHKFTEQECVKAFEDVIRGFQIMVSKGYIHRDIKPANVLLKNGLYKVADFGFACRADIFGFKKINDICGTPIYMAPQLLKNQPYTAKSDIWSLGLMLYQMVFGYTPWPARSLKEYLYGIFNKPLKFPYNGKIGHNTKDFIKRSLVIDQARRMGWKDVFDHPLVKNKNSGQDEPAIQVNEYVKKLLLRIQNDVQRKNLNLNSIIGPFVGNSVSEGTLCNLVREITPEITSHEVSILFQYLDTKKEGWIEWHVIEEKIFNVDFRQSGDVLSRKLDEIVSILHERGDDPQLLFQRIDTNKSGYLDFSQFTKFISSIAPCYTKQQVLHFFQLFDADKNGLISRDEFVERIMTRLPEKNDMSLGSARARRNLKLFVDYMKWSTISPQTIVKLADSDKNSVLDKKEFQVLLNNKLRFHISSQQVQEVFKIIDKTGNGSINVLEIAALIK